MFWYQGMRDHGQGNGPEPVQRTVVVASARPDAKSECWRACLQAFLPFITELQISNITTATQQQDLKDMLVTLGFSIREINAPVAV